jgi:tetratricopeptide (TPR) repeat protein
MLQRSISRKPASRPVSSGKLMLGGAMGGQGMHTRRFLVGLWAWLACPLLIAAEPPQDVQALFSRATTLMQNQQFAEAVPLLQAVTNQAPDRPGGFWNLGLAATAAGEKQLALDAWLHYHELKPDDPQGTARIIQAYQSLGMTRERDARCDELHAYWSALAPAEREKMPLFVRDQFDAGGTHFLVMEYFEPAAPLHHLYRFNALDSAQKIAYFFALESDDSTTQMAREMHQLGPEERMYSVDRFEQRADVRLHATYALMKGRPTYDAVRALVIDSVEGRRKPGSSSSMPR